MSVAGVSMVGLMQRLKVYYVSYIHISCTHSHTRPSVDMRDGAEARGKKMRRAPQRSYGEAANGLYLMKNFQNNTKKVGYLH